LARSTDALNRAPALNSLCRTAVNLRGEPKRPLPTR